MTIEEAEEKLLVILKQVMEEKLTALNVEVSRDTLSGLVSYWPCLSTDLLLKPGMYFF